MKNVIEVSGLLKRYKKAKVNAVDGISFKVKKGEFFALLGPNGAGKTTTISILTTTLEKTSGNIIINNYDVDKHPDKVRENIGVIFQNPSLDLNLTAEENIRLHTNLYGIYPFRPGYRFMDKKYKKKVSELSDILGIKDDIFKPVKTFSGGMKRKLEILRSLTHKPKVLFLDEPTSGLDPESRIKLWDYIRTVQKSDSTTIFLTTHYLEEAEAADRICIIDRGKIIALGTPEKIKKDLINEQIIIDAKDRHKLRNELTNLNLNFVEKEHFSLEMENLKPQDVIKSINTPLSYLKIHSPSLEDVYIQILHNNENN